MARRGNPYAMVRLEPHVMDMIQQLSSPRERGRGGGVSQYLRELVYSHLGLGQPPCFAQPDSLPQGGPDPDTAQARVQIREAAPELA